MTESLLHKKFNISKVKEHEREMSDTEFLEKYEHKLTEMKEKLETAKNYHFELDPGSDYVDLCIVAKKLRELGYYVNPGRSWNHLNGETTYYADVYLKDPNMKCSLL